MPASVVTDVGGEEDAMYYTHGRWTVRKGSEEAFVGLWRALAEWASDRVPGARWAVLLQDRDRPNEFLSFGPWPTLEAIDDFRGRPEFADFLARMRPLLERVETSTLDEVAAAGRGD
ncbi:MAG TPA: antibiotic biosynthesis monooxygenase family protein [Candidatus Binatia bacterium]|nr:antibiotic biosynthesis monooxygenase family protein [Candidatus Binatia bacterium]